ncbi:uncharacterized protein LOC119073076 [Bradysia coprophila]|uniref:uncharacterized protein LOC119073076 n=1 Tax=Bradysia coprophila TaxID=38358 RepID=UPI00187DA9E9|nr:uncharacterized protein LOC119073076 [Bradysia coprophila]
MKKSNRNIAESKFKKKIVKDKSTSSNIASYFQPAEKNSVVEESNKDGVDPTNIYVEALKKKLRDAAVQSQSGISKAVEYESTAKEESQSKQGSYSADGENSCAVVPKSKLPDASGVVQSLKTAFRGQLETSASGGVVYCKSRGKEDQACKEGVRGIDHSDAVCSGANCASKQSAQCTRPECVQVALECREWERKYKEIKGKYLNLTINYSEENIKYKNLIKVATRSNRSDNNEATLAGDSLITSNEVKALDRIPLETTKDSTFIKDCLQYIYKKNLSVLCQKSVKGTSERVEFSADGEEVKRHPAKDPITPEKYDRVKELFIDRISQCDIDPVSHGERLKEANINRLMASGIKNISKKQLKEM